MAQFDLKKIGYQLNIEGGYYSSLDIEGFSLMMKNPSYCYKFYWLEAIVYLISEDVKETNFNEIIDEMIVNAWYSVLEFHIHLSGIIEDQVKDGLERVVLTLQELSGFSGNASKVEIKNKIKEFDKELKPYKEQLTNMVPYRALAGFSELYRRGNSEEKFYNILEKNMQPVYDSARRRVPDLVKGDRKNDK